MRAPKKGLELFARNENRVLRPADFRDVYANPWDMFGYYVGTGALIKAARGYYLLVPESQRGGHWTPEVEAVGLGMAVADYGRDAAALIGPSAARVLGAIPRALGTATVATPRQRPPVALEMGRIQFVKRRVETLDLQRLQTEIVAGWTTSPEQTALDLADRPRLGGITTATAEEAIRVLAARCDPVLVGELARGQRKTGAFQRFTWVAALPPPTHLRPGVPTRGLTRGEGDPRDYGLIVAP